MLNLTGNQPASSATISVPHVPTCRPFAAAPAAKPQQVTGHASTSVPQPTVLPGFTQQPKSTLSFQLPRTDVRPAFGQQAQPSSQPVFGGQSFNLTKQKEAVDPSKQPPQPFTSVPASKIFPSNPTVVSSTASGFPTTTESTHIAAGNQRSAVGAGSTSAFSFSSMSSQSFNFGPPVGQSTPAPAANKLAAQLRLDTPVPATASTTVKTLPASSEPAAVSAAGRTTTGDGDVPVE